MGEDHLIEQTESSRFRKLGLSVLALLLIHFTQYMSGGEITWPIVVVDSVIVLAFVSSNVLDKAFQSGALGNLKDNALKRVKAIAGSKTDG